MINKVNLNHRLTPEHMNNILERYANAEEIIFTEETIFNTGGNMMWTEYSINPQGEKGQIHETQYGNGPIMEKGLCDEVPVERICFVEVVFSEVYRLVIYL